VTQQDAVEHWKKGAYASLKMAHHAYDDGEYELVLFHCHLAVEKALKTLHLSEYGETAPATHDLPYLAGLLKQSFSATNQELFHGLNKFAVAARYSDPFWAKDFATKEHAQSWLEQTSALLPTMFDEV
jgi:HEPN domain-containing protein